MKRLTSSRTIAIAAALCCAFGISAFAATVAATPAVLALLPANGVLIAALLLSSSARWRAVVLVVSIAACVATEACLGKPLVGALIFASANSIEIAIAVYLLQEIRELHASSRRTSASRQLCSGESDQLTGLISRSTLMKHIDAAIRAGSDTIALLFVDLDNFKDVNDTLGHGVGDMVLKTIGARLRNCVRRGDVVARFGGDEFAVLSVDQHFSGMAESTARRISEAINAPIMVSQQDIRIGASIGVAAWQADVQTADEFLRRADIALNAMKATGRGGYKFFDAELDTSLRQRREIEQGLRRALADQRFEVHYQPIVRVATNEIVSFEALVRWRHPTRGLVSPAEFIPIAEESGLIAQIGDWVLRRACRDAADWPGNVKVSVNFSRAQFQSLDAKARLVATLTDVGFSAKRLQLEITETTIMADLERANTLLGELSALGIEIVMDDFGTGYSSLSCLRNCPFDRLKIDRAFVSDLTTCLESRAILAMIVKLAATLGMHTTAEGIETAEQFEIVKNEGCGEVQGFFFSAAQTAEEVRSYFRSRVDQAGTAA